MLDHLCPILIKLQDNNVTDLLTEVYFYTNELRYSIYSYET